MIGNDPNIAGQALKEVALNNGKYTVRSLGKILIRSNVLNSIRHLGSVVGHELNHMSDYVSGNYAMWANRNNAFGNGLTAANALSEIKAYSWNMRMSSSYTNYSELMINYAKMTTNNWRF